MLFWPLFLQIYSDFPELYSEQLVTSQKTPDLVLGLFKSLTVIAFMLQHPIPNFWGNSTAVLTVIFADIFQLSWITRCRCQRQQSPCFVWPFSGRQLRFLLSIVVVVVIKRANRIGEEIFIQVQYLIHLSNYCTIWTVSLVFAVIYSWWIA